MNRYCFVLMGLLVLVGCNQGAQPDAEATTLDDVGEGMKKLLTNDQERDQENDKRMKFLENSLKVREFRGLPIGIPIGNGVLRISVPMDDEGNAVITPSQLRDEWLREANRLRREPTEGNELPAPDFSKKKDPPMSADPVSKKPTA